MSNIHNNNQIKHVKSFNDLIATSCHGEMNAICWERELIGDFSEIIDKVEVTENMVVLSMEQLSELQLSEQGQLAREILMNDFQLLQNNGASPTLNIIKHYERDDSFPFFPTDVYSYHVDRSPIPSNTFLCTYHGESSEIIANSHAQQKILIPEIRAELKKLFDGNENDFDAFLTENFFDLHYQALPDAQHISLGKGHLWKLAIDFPESDSLPCVHRAPKEKNGEKRLLMIC